MLVGLVALLLVDQLTYPQCLAGHQRCRLRECGSLAPKAGLATLFCVLLLIVLLGVGCWPCSVMRSVPAPDHGAQLPACAAIHWASVRWRQGATLALALVLFSSGERRPALPAQG